MKNSIVLGIAAGLLVPAFASAGDHPCKKIEAACEAAGYVKGGAKTGKGLFKDCVKPIANGQPVAGVTVDPADAAACKAKEGSREGAAKP